MRTELVLWWLVIALGLGTFWVWRAHACCQTMVVILNLAPIAYFMLPAFRKTVVPALPSGLHDRFYLVFDPNELKIEAGTTVVWKNTKGRHTVTADDGTFDSPILAAGEEFTRTFDQQGRLQYFCKLHGAAGGHEMSASIIVK